MPLEQVVHRLFDDRLVQPVALGNLDGLDDLARLPLRRTPVQRLAPLDDVVHGADSFLERRVGIRAMAIEQIHIVETETLERTVDRFDQVFAIERIVLIRTVVQPPVQLRRDKVAAAPPAEPPERLAHELFGLAISIDFGVIEEIDAGVVGNRHHLDRGIDVGLVV